MNQFTREELIEIQVALNYWHEGMESLLRDKLQTMIDNYSEPHCTSHKPVRIRFLSGREFDVCEICGYLRRVR